MKTRLLFCTVASAMLPHPFASASEPVIFADFEDGSWGDWQVEGKAFGKKPAIGSEDPRIGFSGKRKLDGWSGEALASSWKAGQGDAVTGRLISPEFKIEKPIIAFLIGGGRHEDLQCLNLVVDDKVVRTATGENSENLIESSWDVSDLKGKTAHIEVIDEAVEGGSWTHIAIDRIEFRDK